MLEHRTQFDDEFIRCDPKGTSSIMSILRPDEANAGLGYHLAVEYANQRHEYSSRYGKISSMPSRSKLNHCLLARQTKYGLHLSQYNSKKCQALTVLINATFLPLLHLHRKMSRAVIWGPIGMGGTALNTNILSLQASVLSNTWPE